MWLKRYNNNKIIIIIIIFFFFFLFFFHRCVFSHQFFLATSRHKKILWLNVTKAIAVRQYSYERRARCLNMMRKQVTEEELQKLNVYHQEMGRLTLAGAHGLLSSVEGEAAKEYCKEAVAWQRELISRYLNNPDLNPDDYAIDSETGELETREEHMRKLKGRITQPDFKRFLTESAQSFGGRK